MNKFYQLTNKRVTLAILFSSSIAAMPAIAQTVSENQKLTALDASPDDRFGTAVAISDHIAIVGARLEDEGGNNAGAAYLFNPTTGVQLLKLIATDGALNDNFGHSVALSGSKAIIGAYFDDLARGSAYLFDTLTGISLFKLTALDRAQEDFFGNSVAISGITAIVGAPFDDDAGANSGSAYLFDTSIGFQTHKLTPFDGTADANFGYSVGISGTTAIIGAPTDLINGVQTGSAYVFDTITGQEIFKLAAPFGINRDLFGFSVAISGNIAIVGASDDDGVGPNSGSAHLFDISTGQHLFKLTADDETAGDKFGYSVAISGTKAIVGALFGDSDTIAGTGSAYIFDTNTGQQIHRLIASDAAATDLFGGSVGISSSKAIIGAVGNDDAGASSGSAYIFDAGDLCLVDLTGDGMLDFFDISAFLTAFAAQDPTADFSEDGQFDFFDLSAFLTEFAAGCP